MNQGIEDTNENSELMASVIRDRIKEEMECDCNFAEKLIESLNTRILIR